MWIVRMVEVSPCPPRLQSCVASSSWFEWTALQARLCAGGMGLYACVVCNIQYHSFSSCEMKLVSWSVSISLGIPTLANSDTTPHSNRLGYIVTRGSWHSAGVCLADALFIKSASNSNISQPRIHFWNTLPHHQHCTSFFSAFQNFCLYESSDMSYIIISVHDIIDPHHCVNCAPVTPPTGPQVPSRQSSLARMSSDMPRYRPVWIA